jgi:hypothetical protein
MEFLLGLMSPSIREFRFLLHGVLRAYPRFRHRLIRFRHFIDGSLALASPSPADPGMLPGLDCNAHHHGFWPQQLAVA